MADGAIYRRRECELCGAFTYEKHIGTSKILDGGFTRIEDFEPSGFGSIVINFWECKNLKNSRVEIKLCPACAGKLDKAIADAIRELKTEAQDGKRKGAGLCG